MEDTVDERPILISFNGVFNRELGNLFLDYKRLKLIVPYGVDFEDIGQKLIRNVTFNSREINDIYIQLDNLYYFSKFRDNDTIKINQIDELNQELKDETGYEFHYFTFFDTENSDVKHFWDRYQPDPKTFEALTTIPSQELYQEFIENPSGKSYNHFAKTKLIKHLPNVSINPESFTGYRKEDLQQAIIKTGLNVPSIPTVVTDRNGNKQTIMVSELSKRLNYKGRYIPGFEWHSNPKALPTSLYMPKIYYEMVYRYIFNTLKYVDWSQVCQLNLISEKSLRKIAQNDFRLNIRGKSYRQLCSMIEDESERKRGISEELIEGIPMAETEIKFRPGSKTVRRLATTLDRFKPEPKLPRVRTKYLDLYHICAKDGTADRYDIFREATEMGIGDLLLRLPKNASKADMCQLLTTYIERIQLSQYDDI